jgi:Icc-related predicted phosphoesterase
MRRRIRKLRRQIKKLGGVDIVVTHSPARGLGDREDPAHLGFQAFRELMEEFQPAYLLHGHVHQSYGQNFQRSHTLGKTTTINTCERYVLERRIDTVDTPYGKIRRKVSTGYGVQRVKLEHDDLARIAKEQNLSLSVVLEKVNKK